MFQPAKDVSHDSSRARQFYESAAGFILKAAFLQELHDDVDPTIVHFTGFINTNYIVMLSCFERLSLMEEVGRIWNFVWRNQLHRPNRIQAGISGLPDLTKISGSQPLYEIETRSH